MHSVHMYPPACRNEVRAHIEVTSLLIKLEVGANLDVQQ